MRRTIGAACAALLSCAAMAGAALATTGGARAARTAAPTVSGLDRESLMTAMEGDRFEIVGGRLALRKTHNRAVDHLARTLISDHTKSYRDAVAVARKVGVPVERSPSPTEKWQLKTLARVVHGKTFNRWYTSLEIADHRQDIQETKAEIRNGTNRAVVADAKSDLPVLKKHLRIARRAHRSVLKRHARIRRAHRSAR